jgi:ubiquinone/menaquinone biosynthesis C-methylase UbiE
MNSGYSASVDSAIYLNESRYETPKEMFRQAAELLGLGASSPRSPVSSLVDLGAATGEFAYYLRGINDTIKLHCVEHNAELVDNCRDFLAARGITISCGDINDLAQIPDSAYGCATSFGVTHIFDDFRPSLGEMIRVTRDGGSCLNVILLNEQPIDLLIRYRSAGSGVAQAGWNKFALASVDQYLEGHPEVASHRFVKHEMPFDIPRRPDNLMRSWTVMTPEGKRILWNGLDMEISLYHVIFTVRKSAQ